jgi:PEP-CTERM motif
MRFRLSLIFIGLISSTIHIASGEVIFSTLGPGNSYDSSSGASFYQDQFLGETLNHNIAVAFTPTITAQFGELLVAVDAPVGPFTVALTQNEDFTVLGGTDGAGAFIESFADTGTGSPELLTLTSVAKPLLTAGTKYWIEISSGFVTDVTDINAGTWFNNDQGITAEVSGNVEFCKLPCAPLTQVTVAPAVEVLSAESSPSVPEPGAIFLMSTGLAVIAFRRYRS